MKNFQEFIKQPFAYLAMVMMGCITYLFIDNKMLHEKIEDIYQKQLKETSDEKHNTDILIEKNTQAIDNNTRVLQKLEFKN